MPNRRKAPADGLFSYSISVLYLPTSLHIEYCRLFFPDTVYIQIFVLGSEKHLIGSGVGNGRSRSAKVVDFGTSRKRVCNFLLVVNSNLGPILRRFRDVAGFLLKKATPPYSTRILGYSLGLNSRCWVCENEGPKLIIHVINFELTQLIRPQIINVADRRTDNTRWQTLNLKCYVTVKLRLLQRPLANAY